MDQKKEYTGTPEEVGAELAVDALGPTIVQAMNSNPPGQVARMVAGMLAGLAGLIAENYGPQAAVDMLRGTADSVEANASAFSSTPN